MTRWAEVGIIDGLPHQLMAIVGWETPAQAAHHSKRANRRRLAGAGMHFIDLGDLDGIEDVPEVVEEEES